MEVYESTQALATGNNGRTQKSGHKSPTPRRFPSPNATRSPTPPAPVQKRAKSTGKRPPSPATPVHDTSVYTELAVRKSTTGGNKLPESLWPSRMRSLNVAFQSNTYSMPVRKKEKPDRKKNTHDHNHSENSKPLNGSPVSRIGSNLLNKSIDRSNESIRTLKTPNPRRMSLSDDTTNRHQRLTSPVSPNLVEKNRAGSRGLSPYRTRAVVSGPSRGTRPGHIRPESPSRQLCSSNKVSVLAFISDMKKGKKVVNRIEDAHHLRLLYNRQVQWRFVNAGSEAALSSQKVTAEKSLVNAQKTTSQLQDSVAAKRINICQIKLQLKLYMALIQQIAYLNQWYSIEREHNFAVNGAIKDLQASTLRLPVTGCATANIQNVKSAVYSAIQVMQTMGSSMQSTLSRLEEANWLVSELATVAAQERALFDQYEALMASASSLQIKEYSLRTHLVQSKNL